MIYVKKMLIYLQIIHSYLFIISESGLQYQIDRVLSSEHSTTYECVASNKIGEGRNQTSIDVICKYPQAAK